MQIWNPRSMYSHLSSSLHDHRLPLLYHLHSIFTSPPPLLIIFRCDKLLYNCKELLRDRINSYKQHENAINEYFSDNYGNVLHLDARKSKVYLLKFLLLVQILNISVVGAV